MFKSKPVSAGSNWAFYAFVAIFLIVVYAVFIDNEDDPPVYPAPPPNSNRQGVNPHFGSSISGYRSGEDSVSWNKDNPGDGFVVDEGPNRGQSVSRWDVDPY